VDRQRSGAERIADERQRQIDAEGYSPKHDDEHDKFELTLAAISYAGKAAGEPVFIERRGKDHVRFCDPWPWSENPSGDDRRIRMLEKAGALIAAEIDRLLRLKGGGNG
jgi:hypothetical protein